MADDPLDEVFAGLPLLLTVDHITALTHFTDRTIRAKLASGEIPGGKRISRNRWLVPKSCVRYWLDKTDPAPIQS
jgi:hypothetical protein